MSLQNQIEGAVHIVSASRELVHKGKIMTVSAKSGKQVDRYAFLVCSTNKKPIITRGYD